MSEDLGAGIVIGVIIGLLLAEVLLIVVLEKMNPNFLDLKNFSIKKMARAVRIALLRSES